MIVLAVVFIALVVVVVRRRRRRGRFAPLQVPLGGLDSGVRSPFRVPGPRRYRPRGGF